MKNCVAWETDTNIRNRVDVLLKGCKCVAGCKIECVDTRIKMQSAVKGASVQTVKINPYQKTKVMNCYRRTAKDLHQMEEPEFAEFVFAAQHDSDSD